MAEIELFYIIKFSNISQIFKKQFYVFWTQTCIYSPNSIFPEIYFTEIHVNKLSYYGKTILPEIDQAKK